MSRTHERAARLARNVYVEFLELVVRRHAYGKAERDTGSGHQTEEKRLAVGAGKKVDNRAPYLATVSGKGGWHRDPTIRAGYAKFTNVSLLDHLCSVVRGAVVLGAVDLLAAGIPEPEIAPRLAAVASVAFLHDADKILGIGRDVELGEDAVATLMSRYGIAEFLAVYGMSLSAAAMTTLIEEVETTRAARMRPGVVLVDRETRRDTVYVRLADRMDSMFLDPSISRSDAVAPLASIEGLRTDALRSGWRTLEIRDPLHPFLLEEFSKAIDRATEKACGHPALLSVHHDGVLTCVVPDVPADDIVDDACLRLGRVVKGSGARVHVTHRGSFDILDQRPSLGELKLVVGEMSAKERSKLLLVRLQDVQAFSREIDDLLIPVGAAPRWPDLKKFVGKLVPMLADDASEGAHADSAFVSLLLQCTDAAPKLGVPNAQVRESELVGLLQQFDPSFAAPDWLASLDAMGRRTLLARYAAGAAVSDNDLRDALLGRGGLCSLWLEGNDARPGLASKIEDAGGVVAEAVAKRFRALLNNRAVVAAEAAGRCHFTNEPVGKDSAISGKSALYAVNVSAFSGREGRVEYVDRVAAETLVSPVALAEHQLRQNHFGKPSGKMSVAVTISSPTSSGLFATLAHPADENLRHLRLSDLLREDAAGVTADGFDGLTRRVAMARYEELPNRVASVKVDGKEKPGQLAFARMVMESALKAGRPMHVFRGLPRPSKAYVSFDFLPTMAEQVIGALELRLEQLRPAIAALEAIDAISKRRGMGAGLAAEAADPATRFSALCSVLDRIERSDAEMNDVAIKRFATNQLEDGGCAMGALDNALVNFGTAMAVLQRAPIHTDGINVAEVGLRIAIEAAEGLAELGQTSKESVLAAVAGSLKREFERSSLFARKEVREGAAVDETIEQAAAVFVDEVWFGAFGGTAPSSRARRNCFAVYRWSFTKAAYARAKAFPRLDTTKNANDAAAAA